MSVAPHHFPVERDRDEQQSISLPPLSVRADIRPGSVNADDRTADVVFSTGAPVQRYDWMSGEKYIETLSLKPKDVRLDRLNAGAPFLNSHTADGVGSILGVVVADSARVANGKGLATIRFSKRAEVEPVWQDIRDGIIRNVSVGYRVHKYEQTTASDGQPARRHAVDWEPYEISAVPMPADAGAQVRTGKGKQPQTNPCLVVRAGKETPEMDQPLHVSSVDTVQPPVAPVPAPMAPEPVEPSEAERGVVAERERIQGILNACKRAHLPLSTAQKWIDEGRSLLEAQDLALQSLETQGAGRVGPQPGPSGIQVVGDDPLKNVWRGVENALLHRALPGQFALEDIGRPYMMRSMLAMVEMCLRHRGINASTWTQLDLANAAFGFQVRGGGMHSTSDFSNILLDATNKILRQSYEQSPQTFSAISRQITVSDFKTVNLTQFGEAPSLLEIQEHGEFKHGTMTDGKETMALATYGRKFSVTRKALINDDLNAFARVPVEFGRAARRLESDLVWQQITGTSGGLGPTMADGNVLFSTAHNNYTSSGTAISVDSLGVGRAAMRIQKGVDGASPLNLRPTYLIVPTTKETLADQYVTVVTPAQSSNVNPFQNKLQVICEPRLDANSTTKWYLAADPSQIDMIVYGYLEGQSGPVVENQVGWNVDGLEIKCRHDFAAKVVDHRGFYLNAGT